MDDATHGVDNIRSDFSALAQRYAVIDRDEECGIRMRMIEMVSHGQAILEVSLKHSGSLFMYAGHEGGAYAKNSFGNIYTAVGVFVLSWMFVEAWGKEAGKMQAQFNKFLEIAKLQDDNRALQSCRLQIAKLN